MPSRKRCFDGQQPGIKNGHFHADKPPVNWSSEGSFVFCIGLHGNSFLRAYRETSRTIVVNALESNPSSSTSSNVLIVVVLIVVVLID